jgi:hypothetical protein
MEEGSSPNSQELSTCAYSEPDQSSGLANHEIASIYSRNFVVIKRGGFLCSCFKTCSPLR